MKARKWKYVLYRKMKIALIADLHLWFTRKSQEIINSHWLDIYENLIDFLKSFNKWKIL